MSKWFKMAVAVTVVLMPGGLALLFAAGFGRAVWLAWHLASERSQGEPIRLRSVVSAISFRQVYREARAAF